MNIYQVPFLISLLTQNEQNFYDFSIVFRDFSFVSECKSFNHLLIPHMIDIYLNKIQNFPNANWSECINIVESTIENLNRNINPELELYSFLMNINDCLKGKLINRLAS